jgi:hypothetical protein
LSESIEGAVKGLGIFSTLEAATKPKFFFLAAAFTLLVDNVFLTLHQPTLLEIAGNSTKIENPNLVIKVILIFVGFSFLTSLVLPVLAGLCDTIYSLTVGNLQDSLDRYLNKKFGGQESNFRREYGYVNSFELREKAHKSKEKYFLDLYEAYTKKWHSNRDSMLEFALVTFYCLCMLCWNFYLGWGGGSAISVLVANYFGSENLVWWAIIGLLGLFFRRFFSDDGIDWIYCPSLYDEIMTTEGKVFRYD